MGPRLGTAVLYAALLLLASLLVLPRLSDRYLWEDEAETALLARNVLAFGVPIAWDGRDLVSQECGLDLDENYLWRHTPWLPVYLTAGAFHLLGVSTGAARLPFVLLGLAALPSLAVLARVAFRDRAVELLAVTILALSVPFLLHVRQARYYAPAILATVWLLVAFFAALARGRPTVARRVLSTGGLVVAATALVHSSYLIALATLAGMVVSLAIVRPDRDAIGRLASAAAIALALNAPWLLILDLPAKVQFAAGGTTAGEVWNRLVRYLAAVEVHALPSLILAPVLAWALWRGRDAGPPPGTRAAAALTVITAGHLLALALSPLVFHRYFVNLLPLFALMAAWVIRTAGGRSLVVAAAALVLIVLVDRADAIRLRPGSTVLKYVGEITHDFEGPIEALAAYLATAGRPGDRVYATYGALALRFHTGLEVRGGTACQGLAGWPPPDWLVVRYFLRLNPAWGPASADTADTVRYLNAHLASRQYQHVQLSAVDTVHDSIPEPDIHVYRTPTAGRPVTLFRRVTGGAPASGASPDAMLPGIGTGAAVTGAAPASRPAAETAARPGSPVQ